MEKQRPWQPAARVNQCGSQNQAVSMNVKEMGKGAQEDGRDLKRTTPS